ncbi:hypothetical protein Scep_008313 [Stephania cephalantha]|uniref:Phylloplanin n=1 Tax=Stephania cephalantha TaxID=152367 RepID=A0AAP0KBF6_9MAGN
MALKSLLFASLLVAWVAAPLAGAQLGGLGNLLGLIRIQGTLFCTANGNAGINGAATPVFPNALVQLQCGAGNVVSSSTTNSAGVFSILLDPIQFLLSSVLSNCNLVVNTPLSTCNSALTGGGILSSPLQLVGKTVAGIPSLINLIPAGFSILS